MRQSFKNPGTEYRPIPFWSWNDALEPEVLREQIGQMADKGMGGYFMHARGGLTLDYLGEEWFTCVEAGIDEGKKYGLDAWIYDEEGWPSGFAGGLVPKMSEDYQAKLLKLAEYDTPEEADLTDALAVFVFHRDNTCSEVETDKKDDGDVILTNIAKIWKRGDKLAVVRRVVQKTYIDVMNKDAVNAFIGVTHEEYYRRFGEDFGTGMKGFFTDEPRFTCNRFGDMPWSDTLPEEYNRRYGVSLRQDMLSLWKPCGEYRAVRYRFWTMVNDLFVHHYMQTLYDWCEAHHCMLTGHIMMEESIFGQMTGTGGVMPFYEYEHIPGIDWLRRRIESPVIAKQVSSVACQLGKKKVITESFALSGWNISFEEMKWILEWQYVNGVNLLCQHLEAYSLKGSRKRDYPPSLFYQQSWWKEWNHFTDYVGRLGTVLSEGSEQADVLVLHPMRSGYVCYDGNRPDALRVLDDHFQKLSKQLSGEHVSYHYGDETIMGKYGRVEGKTLVVGAISYKTVILPDMYAMDKSTLKLLTAFAENGGTVLYTGEFPSYTNGEEDLLHKLQNRADYIGLGDIRGRLTEASLVSTGVSENGQEIGDISQQIRQTEDGLLLFLVNHSRTASHRAQVSVYGRRMKAELLSAEDGESTSLACDNGQDTVFSLEFLPMQSYIVALTDTEERLGGHSAAAVWTQIIVPGPEWEISRMGRNSLTLDICRYSIDGGELTGTLPVIKLMKLLLDRQKDSRIELEYDFDIRMSIENNREFLLALEDAGQYAVSLNGRNIPCQVTGWWKDRSFQTIDLKPFIKEGRNTLKLTGVFHQDPYVYEVLYGKGMYETEKNRLTYNMEMESVYLIGDFGVKSQTPFTEVKRGGMFTEGPFVITDKPVRFTHQEFASQGLLFFAEELAVKQKLILHREEGKKSILRYGRLCAPAAEIFLNGKLVKTAVWAPYEADITQLLQEGENVLEICFYPSNRNLLGPHHHTSVESYRVGPMSFTGQWSWVERESEADATDFEDKTRNYWKDEYCFVRLGFE